MRTVGERYTIAMMTADEIRTKILDPHHSNLNEIAASHPEVIEQLIQQYENDKRAYGKIPTFVTVQTNSGLVNTTIRYSDLIRFIPLFQQRPDLIGTTLADGLAKRKEVTLQKNSYLASELFGLPTI
jgi:hypothetical protein